MQAPRKSRTGGRGSDPGEAEQGAPSEEALVDALIIDTMNRRDAHLQREIESLRGLVEQVAGTAVLQRVIENGIGDVFDRLGDLTGRPKPASDASNMLLAKIERELSRPPNTDLFRATHPTFPPSSLEQRRSRS
ncbi:hypothetical protein EDF57_104404 [Novosphingobium sp. PhB55]|uniref:hypothetical protein n=1 Tax=Novosphingobium sp. PhB55 TaxID=2485106 RepID=UPI0010662444|nr:hypothetical protein [Novosphingobium sp. PhB55]TDW64605.1 hypothetical protein EDF57_104404 [Novosphingobium sp. PhB55]